MSSTKIKELQKLRERIVMDTNGFNKKQDETRNIYIANHSCLKDGFYLPMALDYDIVTITSARITYKNQEDRKEVFDKYLYTMPMEAHGGKIYSDMCLEYVTKCLTSGLDICIFPEGAYVDENIIYRGRTGGSRVLFDALSYYDCFKINFIPVAIDVNKKGKDLDSYCFDGENVKVTFLDPIDYTNDYKEYINTTDIKNRNECLHHVTDEAIKSIASYLNREYVNSYIELFNKGNVIFSNGSTVSTEIAQDPYYTGLYRKELEKRSDNIIKKLIK